MQILRLLHAELINCKGIYFAMLFRIVIIYLVIIFLFNCLLGLI